MFNEIKSLNEECGVFGVFGAPDASQLTYLGLHNLQHRGQEGMVSICINTAIVAFYPMLLLIRMI